MHQRTKSTRPHWLHLKQVSLPLPSKRCFNHLSHRHSSSTSTRHRPMWRMQCPNITRLSFRQHSLPLTLRCLSLTTTIWIPWPIISLQPRKTQGWHPNWQWLRQLRFPIHRGQLIMPLSLLPGSHVINCHCSKHRYPRLRGQVRATTRVMGAKTTTIHTL